MPALPAVLSMHDTHARIPRWRASRRCSGCGLTPPTCSSSWSPARPPALPWSARRVAPFCSLRLAKCEPPRSAAWRRQALSKPALEVLPQTAPLLPLSCSLRLSERMWWRPALTTSAARWTAQTGGATFRSACSGLTRSGPSRAAPQHARTRCACCSVRGALNCS